MADWESADKVQKSDAGEFRALIGGEWVPVAKAQKSDSGQYRIMRNDAVPSAPTIGDAKQSFLDQLEKGTLIERYKAGTILYPNEEKFVRQTLNSAASGPLAGIVKAGAKAIGADDVAAKISETAKDGNMVGSLLQPDSLLVGGGANTLASKIPVIGNYLRNVVGGAGSGAVIGGLSEDGSAGSGAAVGGGLAASLGPLGWAGQKLWNVGRNITSGAQGQAQNYLADIFGNKAERAKEIARLLRLNSGVMGEQPTVGMAAVSGGEVNPAYKALEEGARTRQTMASEFANRDATNEAARATPFRAIMAPGSRIPAEQGMPVNKSMVEAVRGNITKPLYAEAGNDIIPIDNQLLTVLGGAEIQPAARRAGVSLDQAIANANAAGRTPPPGYTQPKTTPAPEGTPYWAQNPAPTPTVEPGTISINALQRIKNEIDKDISTLSGTSDSAGITKLSQLRTARSQLDGWMRGKSEKWGQSQDTYKDLSVPQNQADVAEVLLKALQSPSGVERSTAFGNAFRNAPRTLNSAGVPIAEELGQVFSPTQMKWANAVKASTDREGQYAALKAPQSILPEVNNAVDAIKDASPNWLSVGITAFHKVMAKVGGKMDAQSQVIIDSLMLDPRKLAAFMQQATPAERDVVSQYIASIPSIPNGVPTAAITASTQRPNERQKALAEQLRRR